MPTDTFTREHCITRRHALRTLNDQLRTSLDGCQVVITHAVAHHAPGFALRATACVQAHIDFPEGDDPHGEHDFGAFDLDGHRMFWKIDHYDKDMVYSAEDPTDRANTVSVLTIMFASDY